MGFFDCFKRRFSIVRPPNYRPERSEKNDGPRINGEIETPKVRLVDADGEMRGVVALREALVIAEEAGLDLVEVSPNAEPPVCKILDYGKYKYELQKKASEARKKQHVIDVKEIKLRPMIEEHDFNVKMKNAKTFLSNGDKLKVTLRFRGREMAHQNIAQDLLKRVQDELEEFAKVDSKPSFEGRQIVMIMSSKMV